MKAIESYLFPGYYHHPDRDYLLVSEEGKVIDTKTGVCLLPIPHNFWPYPVVYDGSYAFLLHRLVLETFEPDGRLDKSLVANHIDGDKFNSRKSNLEWVSRKRNAVHAFESGLRSDNRPVDLRDLRTGAVKSFYGLNQCARYLGVNQGTLHLYLNSKQNVPFMTFYNIRYNDGEWKKIDATDIGRAANGVCKDVILHKTDDDTYYIFSSAGEAARFVGRTGGAVTQAARTGGYLAKVYKVRYLDHDEVVEKAEVIPKPEKIQTIKTMSEVPIVVTDIETGTVTNYPGVSFFCKEHGFLKNTVQKSMLLKQGIWKKYLITYV